jgi:hypothetical protein
MLFSIFSDTAVQGVYRSFLAAGEAVCFGLDSIAVPYLKEAGTIFAFYAAGVLVFLYLAIYHITDTEYFAGEEGVVIPKHVVEENPDKVAEARIELTVAGPEAKHTVVEASKQLSC